MPMNDTFDNLHVICYCSPLSIASQNKSVKRVFKGNSPNPSLLTPQTHANTCRNTCIIDNTSTISDSFFNNNCCGSTSPNIPLTFRLTAYPNIGWIFKILNPSLTVVYNFGSQPAMSYMALPTLTAKIFHNFNYTTGPNRIQQK
jgi:hypothetical protein